jgi:PAS domain S-box-containing protein
MGNSIIDSTMTLLKNYKNDFKDRLAALYDEIPALALFEDVFSKLEEVNICIKDIKGHYLWVNEGFLKSCPQWRRDDVIGKTAFEIYPEMLATTYHKQDEFLLAKGKSLQDQLEMISNSDGSVGWYTTNKVLIRNHLGIIRGIMGVSRELHAPTSKDPRFSKLSVALQRMRNDFRQPLRISDLAKESGLSISQFERLMQAMIQITPKQYLIRQRVEAAAVLLRQTNDSVADVAMKCGFSDQPSFCKQFKVTTGLSPLQYRRLPV